MHSQQPSRRQGPYQPQSDNPSQRPPWEEPPGQYQRPPGEQSPGGPYQPPPVTPYQSPPDGLYQQALPPRRPHRVRNWVFGVGAGMVILLVGIAIGSAGAKAPNTTPRAGPTVTLFGAAQPAPAVTVTVSAKPKAPAMSTMSGDGVFVVGMDIRRGTYHTTGATGGSGGDCYYALLSSTNTSDIIDNNNVTGPATITVGPGVKAVDTSGCNTWHRIGG